MEEQPISDAAQIWAEDEYRFHGQRPDEHVMLVRNQHLIVLVPFFTWAVISLVLPYFLVRLFDGQWLVILQIIYWALLVFFVARRIYAYTNGMSILTTHRILNVDQRGFFSRRITEAELTRIQDVSTEIKGVLPTMFGYGTVTIRTASKDTILLLQNIGDPYDVQQAIVRALKDVQK